MTTQIKTCNCRNSLISFIFRLILLISLTIGISPLSFAAEPTAFETWARTARIGGAAIWIGMTDAEMNSLLNKLAAQHVSVIEADSDLSNYLTEAEFEQELALIRTFTQKAHAHANKFKVVWYYPALEVLTANAASTPNTMAKNHPDWIQLGIDGASNVFIGGSGQVFWVDPGMESAWMSPSSPYRDYFQARVARIANETGVDGLWVDVPLYSDFGPVRWADANPFAAAQFQSTNPGFTTPTTENWTSLAWRRWIAWRHDELRRFIADAAAAARQNNPEFAFIVETLPTDYTMSTVYGLEGVSLRDIEGVSHVWEVDTLSNNTAMRRAREDDWISYISMQKYIKAASGTKPAWSFAYGKQANDAALVMAEILAAGNNPYELKIPEMTTTVGAAHRTKMFGWIKANENHLWRNSAARVGVLYSPTSRDYVDQAKGEGMYVTTNAGGDALWWNDDPTHSAYQRQYVAEYRGMIKLLVHNHIPFDAVIKPASAADLAKYQTLILPDYQSASDAEIQIIRDYVSNGGHVIVTGPNPSGLDRFGSARSEYALADVFGVSKSGSLPASQVHGYGAGEARVFAGLLGKKYFTNASDSTAAAANLLAAINANTTAWLTTNANKKVHMELTETDDELILQYVNFIGVTGTFTVVPTTVSTTLNVPAGRSVEKVELTSPDNATSAKTLVSFTTNANGVTFTTPVTQYALVVVTLTDSGGNKPPVANVDVLATTQGVPLNFSEALLLQNDTDPDGHPLTITTVSTSSSQGGTISGNYLYTPLASFSGTDTFSYTVSDGNGGAATGSVIVTVTGTPVNHPPVAGNDSYSTSINTALNVVAPGLLANDSDPDGNALNVIANSPSANGTIIVGADGSFSYTPNSGFTGSDSFTYTISDGKGENVIATATITISAGSFTPQTVFPTGLTIATGKFDTGTTASLTASDADTYDVNSTFVAAVNGGVTDWYASAKVNGSASAISEITLTYSGHYSKANVSQQVSLYNYTTNSWDIVDTRTVGNSDDVTVTIKPANPAAYISSSGEMQARVRGFRAGAQSTAAWKFFCWANVMKWDVK